MKIIIYVDDLTGEIFYYIPSKDGEAVFIEPPNTEPKNIKENSEDNEPVIH